MLTKEKKPKAHVIGHVVKLTHTSINDRRMKIEREHGDRAHLDRKRNAVGLSLRELDNLDYLESWYGNGGGSRVTGARVRTTPGESDDRCLRTPG